MGRQEGKMKTAGSKAEIEEKKLSINKTKTKPRNQPTAHIHTQKKKKYIKKQ